MKPPNEIREHWTLSKEKCFLLVKKRAVSSRPGLATASAKKWQTPRRGVGHAAARGFGGGGGSQLPGVGHSRRGVRARFSARHPGSLRKRIRLYHKTTLIP